MSNRVFIEVLNISTRSRPNESHQEIYIHDIFESSYVDCKEIPLTPKELFLCCKNNGSDVVERILELVVNGRKGITIEGEYFETEQIQEWLNEESVENNLKTFTDMVKNGDIQLD